MIIITVIIMIQGTPTQIVYTTNTISIDSSWESPNPGKACWPSALSAWAKRKKGGFSGRRRRKPEAKSGWPPLASLVPPIRTCCTCSIRGESATDLIVSRFSPSAWSEVCHAAIESRSYGGRSRKLKECSVSHTGWGFLLGILVLRIAVPLVYTWFRIHGTAIV